MAEGVEALEARINSVDRCVRHIDALIALVEKAPADNTGEPRLEMSPHSWGGNPGFVPALPLTSRALRKSELRSYRNISSPALISARKACTPQVLQIRYFPLENHSKERVFSRPNVGLIRQIIAKARSIPPRESKDNIKPRV